MSGLIYVDAKGDKQALDLNVGMYEAAAEKGQSLSQYMANLYPTNAEKYGTAYEQALEQAGVFVRGNSEYGLRASTVGDVLNPKNAAAIVKDGVPASRILFPAVIMDVIEDKLTRDYATNPSALSALVGVEDSIQGDRWERPVLNFSRPESARSGPVAQLAMPNSMLTITASDKSMRIPSWGIGLEISEQAQKSTTLDLVGLAVARQAAVEANERAQGYILSLLNGDSDYSMAALSTFSGKVQTANSFDSTLTAGNISFKAWIKWLTQRANYRTITHVVTNLDGLLAIRAMYAAEKVASGSKDNPAGMDINVNIVNPNWPTNVKFVLTNDPNWPANTYLGVDSRYGVHRVNSLSAQYSAIESFALKRSTALRIDKGELVYRLFDESFEVLSLTI